MSISATLTQEYKLELDSWPVKLILSLNLNTLKGEPSLPYKLKWITDSCFSGFVFLSTAPCIIPASVSCCSPGLLATTLHCCASVCSPFLSYPFLSLIPCLPHLFPSPSLLVFFCPCSLSTYNLSLYILLT